MRNNRRMDRGWRSIKTVIALGVLAMLLLPAVAAAQEDPTPANGGGYRTFTGYISTDGVFGSIPPGAQWRIKKSSGGSWSSWKNHGDTYSFEKDKTYVVNFKDVTGYTTPSDHSFKKSSNYSYTGDYKKVPVFTGYISTDGSFGTIPDDGTNHGQWRIRKKYSMDPWSSWKNHGDTYIFEKYTTYQVEFKYVSGYDTPSGHEFYKNSDYTYTGDYKSKKGTLNINILVYGFNGGPLPSPKGWSFSTYSDSTTTGSSWSQSVPSGNYNLDVDPAPDYWTRNVDIVGPTCPPNGGYPFSVAHNKTTTITITYTQLTGFAQLFMDRNSADIYPVSDPQVVARWHINNGPSGYPTGNYQHGEIVEVPAGENYAFSWDDVGCWNNTPSSVSEITIPSGNTYTDTSVYTRQTFLLQVNMTYDVPLQVGETPGTASIYDGSSTVFSGLTDGAQVTLNKGTSYSVIYSSIPFYNTPAPIPIYIDCENVVDEVDASLPVNVADVFATREYTRKTGLLTVILQEDGVAPGPAGAQYTVTGYGGSFPLVGTSAAPFAIYQGMAYSVAFNTIPNYDTPLTPVGVTLPDGDNGVPSQIVYGNYLIHLGSLVGFANVPDGTGPPPGSKWRIVGTPDWQGIGNIIPNLPLGTYKVEYDFVDDYITPFIRDVTIGFKGELADTLGIYIPIEHVGSLQVFIEPKKEVIPEGAMWRPVVPVKGVSPVAYPWQNSGDIVHDLPVGSVGIEFYVAPGWILPELTGATIKRDELTKGTGEYIRPLIVHAADYNGDGLDDLGAFDSSTGKWTVVSTVALSPPGKTVQLVDTKFGTKDDIAAPGDYDGDGIADLAFYREKTGEYRIKQATGSLKIKKFGEDRDIPVPGDYDGDGKTDAALYRPSTGKWIFYRIFEDMAPGNKVTTFMFGWNGAVPVPGDYNADGMTDLAVYDVKARTWHVAVWKKKKGTWVNVKTLQTPYGKLNFPVQHGEIGNIPIQADYDGDGSSDIAIFRRGDANFNVLNQYEIQVGRPGDMPVPNDWAGLGRVIPAVFRANAGRWIAVDNLLGTRLLDAKHGANSTPLMSGR